MNPPAFADILDAAERLRPHAVVTPLLEASLLNAEVGGRILVKAEVLQRTGSFKFRGAYNRISRMTADELARGAICFSSGNHAQGVAAAAQLCGTHATIVMPASAPALKVARCRALGAEVVLHDGDRRSMERRTEILAAEHGLVLVRPFDDPHVIAGQGTIGLELADQLRAADAAADAIVIPCSGGGLTAGIALAAERRIAGAKLYTAEPEGFDDTARSLRQGARIANQPGASSICDALQVPEPGVITFAINRRRVSAGLVVSDDEARSAMEKAFEHLKIVIEPGGAAALAAALAGRVPTRGRTIVVVASGGNVDPEVFASAIAR
jgi:threonine dehydratase